MDDFNVRFGRGAVKLGDIGLSSEGSIRQERRSPDYMSDWAQLPCGYWTGAVLNQLNSSINQLTGFDV